MTQFLTVDYQSREGQLRESVKGPKQILKRLNIRWEVVVLQNKKSVNLSLIEDLIKNS